MRSGEAVQLENLGFCLLGVPIGTAIGVLPGIGPIPTIALLLPFTFGMEPAGAMIMLAGIFCGAQHGGSTAAILGQCARRDLVGRHLPRRSPDGAAGPGRHRARHRRDLVLLRRHGRDPRHRAAQRAP